MMDTAYAADALPATAVTEVTPWLVGVLDEIDYGVMLLDASGHVHHANHLAQRECGATRPLRLVGQRLRTAVPADQRQLDQALAAAACQRRSLLRLEGAPDDPPIAVVPLAGVHGSGGASMVLLFGRRRACETLSLSLYARLQGLTPAESTVLEGLCRGLRPAAVARELGVALSTVRSQVLAVRAKTGCASIRALVELVATLLPVASALPRLAH